MSIKDYCIHIIYSKNFPLYRVHRLTMYYRSLSLHSTVYSCNPSCRNGGTCVAQNQCSCTSQWTGSNCGTCKCCMCVCVFAITFKLSLVLHNFLYANQSERYMGAEKVMGSWTKIVYVLYLTCCRRLTLTIPH